MTCRLRFPLARLLAFLIVATALSSCAHLHPVARRAEPGADVDAEEASTLDVATLAGDTETMRELAWVGGQALPLGVASEALVGVERRAACTRVSEATCR